MMSTLPGYIYILYIIYIGSCLYPLLFMIGLEDTPPSAESRKEKRKRLRKEAAEGGG